MGRELAITALLVLVYRIGVHIPLPGVPVTDLTASLSGSAIALADMFTGGALARASLLSLGVMPYITAQIVVQMIGYAVPSLGEHWNTDEASRLEQVRLCRWLGLAIGLAEAVGYTLLLPTMGVDLSKSPLGVVAACAVVIVGLVVGEALVMLMGELIDQLGVGQGMSVLIFANVISTVPPAILRSLDGGPKAAAETVLVAAFLVAAMAAIVWVELGYRRIPVQLSASGAAGAHAFGSMTYIPIKVNTAGVVPVMVASAILFVPQAILLVAPNAPGLKAFATAFSTGPVSWAIELVVIIALSYAYALVVVDPDRIADEMARRGNFIPGVRPGADTARLIRKVISDVTLPGALFMAVLAIVPQVLFYLIGNPLLSVLGGTSLLIIVGVAVNISASLEGEAANGAYADYVTEV